MENIGKTIEKAQTWQELPETTREKIMRHVGEPETELPTTDLLWKSESLEALIRVASAMNADEITTIQKFIDLAAPYIPAIQRESVWRKVTAGDFGAVSDDELAARLAEDRK